MLESEKPTSGQTTMPSVRRMNIRDDVYDLLRGGILNHSYPPGHRLDLDELSQQLQVSRTPVKEALHRLEGEGLIQILPRRGTFVSALDATNIAESYDVRLALERFVAQTVVRNISERDVQGLRDMRTRMQALLQEPNFTSAVERYIKLDQEFHNHIMTCSGNARLLTIYRTVGGPLQLARVLNKFDVADYRNCTEPEHGAILKSIESRDGAALQAALTQHIERAKARVLARISQPMPAEATA